LLVGGVLVFPSKEPNGGSWSPSFEASYTLIDQRLAWIEAEDAGDPGSADPDLSLGHLQDDLVAIIRENLATHHVAILQLDLVCE
jgi:hypothetical protein